jgi:outer membrane lipoprotein-sorting protein
VAAVVLRELLLQTTQGDAVTRRIAVRWFVFLLASLIAVATLAQLPPSRFAADMKFTRKDMSATGKLYFGGSKVRMEMNAMGRQSIMITDSQRKVIDMLMPDQHMYMEMSTEMAGRGKTPAPDWHMYDPANPCANSPDTTCQRLGTGLADGRLCDKWLFTHKRGTTQTVWIDQKTGIPIRTEGSDGSLMELTNINQGSQSDSLFEIPAGYTKFDMGTMMKGAQKSQ